MGLTGKLEIKKKKLRNGRGLKKRNEREKMHKTLMSCRDKKHMPFMLADDYIYVNTQTCLVWRNLDQSVQYS